MIGGMLTRIRLVVGLALAVTGVALWAVAVTVLVPAAQKGDAAAMAGPDTVLDPDTMGVLAAWVHDLRWAAIVVVACGLALTARGSAVWKPAVPAVCGMALVIADGAFDAADATGWGAAAIACGVALAIVSTAVAVLRARESMDRPRWPLIYGIVAAWCSPLLLTNLHDEESPVVPAGLPAGVGVAQALLVFAAFACAAFSVSHIPPRAVPAAAGFAAVLGAAGILSGGNAAVLSATLLGGPLIAVVVLLTGPPRSVRRYLTFVAIATVAYPFLVSASLIVGVGPAWAALALSGDSYLAEGVGVAMPGGILAGAVAGVLTVRARARRPVVAVSTGMDSHLITDGDAAR
ncbi:hypothetical protein [Actinomadura alba]|uniref:Integral membrane protein n=1 Tax=Actinomadura alba TaxID=406431 RepID=A0ABR7LWM1_9ACTN|nr:hypothetical protein [Actinomadura alba]MBC6469252.1 hypothetical protein [Actinomadura alba]